MKTVNGVCIHCGNKLDFEKDGNIPQTRPIIIKVLAPQYLQTINTLPVSVLADILLNILPQIKNLLILYSYAIKKMIIPALYYKICYIKQILLRH